MTEKERKEQAAFAKGVYNKLARKESLDWILAMEYVQKELCSGRERKNDNKKAPL